MTRNPPSFRSTPAGSTPTWRRAVEVFERSIDLDPDERRTFVASACAGDEALRSRVERLIEHDEATSGLDTGAVSARALEAVSPLAPGSTVGAFRVVRRLGSGGMATVYLAERTDGEFDQQVAIKVLGHGIDPKRFQIERQVLARLNHPHIARLLDGGTLPDGRPYVVMEYVDGETLLRACDGRRLPVRQRLRLMIQLGEAVAAAHQKLVIHRDLKPANVLVDGEGRVKLLDFGIAKLLHDARDPSSETVTQERRLTPGYSSPEQLRGELLGTASDVYSLGVILYELLCGRRPFEDRESSPAELEAAMRERVPTPPSRRVAAAGDAAERRRLAACRGTSPERLRRRLRGDLDRIVLHALHHAPERRYPSVRALTEDLLRFLDGRPVRARGSGTGYRLGKWVRRHRVATAAALALLALGAVQQARILHERNVASHERDVARDERDTARATQEFLVELFEVSDPSESRGNTVTAREILDRGADRIREELQDQPHVRAEMMATIGEVYFNLGLYDPAEPLLQEALSTRRRRFGDVSEEVAESLRLLATLHYHQGRYAAGVPLVREALEVRRSLFGDEHELVADAMDLLGILLMLQGELDSAEPLFRRALAIQRARLGSHLAVADTLNNLAGLLKRKGDFDGAERLYRESLAMVSELFDEAHPSISQRLNNLGSLLLERGDEAAAEPLLRDALAMWRELFDQAHPEIAVTLTNLSEAVKPSRPDEAIRLAREALDMRRELLGERHPQVAVNLANLANLQAAHGDLEEAERHLRLATDILHESLGADHWMTGVVTATLARVLSGRGRHEESVELAEQSLRVVEAALGSEHIRTVSTRITLSIGWIGVGRYEEAERQLLASLHTAEDAGLGSVVADVHGHLEELYAAWGRPGRLAELAPES